MAAWGSAASQGGFAVELGQRERGGGCQRGGAGGRLGVHSSTQRWLPWGSRCSGVGLDEDSHGGPCVPSGNA